MMNATLVGDIAIRGSLARLNTTLSDTSDEIEEVTDFISGRIDAAFLESQSIVSRLADSTIASRKARVARGENLVAALSTPLRAFGDSIREAATATSTGVLGSAYESRTGSVTVGVDETATEYMRVVLLGGAGKPERNIIATAAPDIETETQKIFDAALSRKLAIARAY